MLRDEPAARVTLRGRLMHPYYQRRFAEFGPGAVLHKPMWLYGTKHMSLGAGVFILHGAWISVARPAWGSPEPALRIADGVVARPHVTISVASSVVLERNVALAAYVSIIDNEHTWFAGAERPLDNPLASAPIRVGESTLVAERVSILGGADIGKFCIIGANSVVKGHIPDYSVAVGAPARVVGTTHGKGTDAFVDDRQ
jgi:acetyltransferase-like isoleucine patch superfamily enzyme